MLSENEKQDAVALRLQLPMLARSGTISSGDYAFELKRDGLRAARMDPRAVHTRAGPAPN